MIKVLVLSVALLLVTACGAAPSTATGTNTAPTPTAASTRSTASIVVAIDPSPSAPATPAVDQTSLPVPTATDMPILPSATGEGPSGASTDDTILCTFTQSGGLVGSTDTVTVRANGEVTAERARPRARAGTTQATPEQLATLRASIESDAWQQLQGRYGKSVPDGFTYTVQCGGNTITTYDGAERPAPLGQVIQQLGALRQQALDQ